MTQLTSLAEFFAADSDTDWRTDAACKGWDPETFFSPDLIESKEEKDRRELVAKSVCVECAVRKDCLNYSIKAAERYGIWGGLTELERRAAARRGLSSVR